MTTPRILHPGIATARLQFALLVVLNAFVGGMVGLERTVVPLLAQGTFAIASAAAALSFIATFGGTKALVNLFAGGFSDRWGRRRVLVLGWMLALPVPLLLLWAPSWEWVLVANVFLGVNQGLTWSMTLNMKLDIASTRQRGIATGFNEFAGYTGLALVALASGLIAARWGLRPEPFYLGLALAVGGLSLALLVRETSSPQPDPHWLRSGFGTAFRRGSGGDAGLTSLSFAGLATNLKDGVLWGLLPGLLAAQAFDVETIGLIVATYPWFWGISQLAFGPLSDRVGRRMLVVPGLALQAVGLGLFALAGSLPAHLTAAAVVGLGTGMVYPTLLAFVSDLGPQAWRGAALGVYRFWRDLGYLVGAIGAGLLADAAGTDAAIGAAGVLAALAAAGVALGARPPAGDGAAAAVAAK